MPANHAPHPPPHDLVTTVKLQGLPIRISGSAGIFQTYVSSALPAPAPLTIYRMPPWPTDPDDVFHEW